LSEIKNFLITQNIHSNLSFYFFQIDRFNMKSFLNSTIFLFTVLLMTSCGQKNEAIKGVPMKSETPSVTERLKQFAPTIIKADLSKLSENDKKAVMLLVEAGKIADAI